MLPPLQTKKKVKFYQQLLISRLLDSDFVTFFMCCFERSVRNIDYRPLESHYETMESHILTGGRDEAYNEQRIAKLHKPNGKSPCFRLRVSYFLAGTTGSHAYFTFIQGIMRQLASISPILKIQIK